MVDTSKCGASASGGSLAALPTPKRRNLHVNIEVTDLPNATGRFVKLDEADQVMRAVDLCKHYPFKECKEALAGKLTWDDPRSPWTGEGRFVRPMWVFEFHNGSGQTAWFTKAPTIDRARRVR
jgi:hypothetical protein